MITMEDHKNNRRANYVYNKITTRHMMVEMLDTTKHDVEPLVLISKPLNLRCHSPALTTRPTFGEETGSADSEIQYIRKLERERLNIVKLTGYSARS